MGALGMPGGDSEAVVARLARVQGSRDHIPKSGHAVYINSHTLRFVGAERHVRGWRVQQQVTVGKDR